MTPAQLTLFAAAELARRKAKAREAIAARRHTEAQAEALLAPYRPRSASTEAANSHPAPGMAAQRTLAEPAPRPQADGQRKAA